MRLPFSIGALVALCATAPLAYAAPRGVELSVDPDCAGVDRAQLLRLLNIEQRREPDSSVKQARVSVECSEGAVTLQVEPGGDEPARVRQLRESDVAGDVGARVLSLAAIELLGAEPQPAEPAPPPRMAPRPAPPPPAPPPPEPAPAVRLMLVGTMRSFAMERPLAGGGLSVDYLRLSKLGLRLDFDVGVASHDYEYGSAHLQLSTISAQAGYLALYDDWSARLYAGYRLGAARITGETNRNTVVPVGTVAGACGGPLLSGGLGFREGSWVLELSGEAGLVSFPLEGSIAGHDAISFDKYWLGLSLNVGALL